MTTEIDSISQKIENAIMDHSMRFYCDDCGKILGYMDSNLFNSGDEFNWIICGDCYGKISIKND